MRVMYPPERGRSSLPKVVYGDLCSVYSWYDNEFGYRNSLVAHVAEAALRIGARA